MPSEEKAPYNSQFMGDEMDRRLSLIPTIKNDVDQLKESMGAIESSLSKMVEVTE